MISELLRVAPDSPAVMVDALEIIDDLIREHDLLDDVDHKAVRQALNVHRRTTTTLRIVLEQERQIVRVPVALPVRAAYLDFCFSGLALAAEGTIDPVPSRLTFLAQAAAEHALDVQGASHTIFGLKDPRPGVGGKWREHAAGILQDWNQGGLGRQDVSA